MSKHEQYEELCVLASIGEASPSEIHQLRQHLDDCPECRKDYNEFVEFVLPQLSFADETSQSRMQATIEADSTNIRSRFLKRAQVSGLEFSAEALHPKSVDLVEFPKSKPVAPSPIWKYRRAIAASLIVVSGGLGYIGATKFGPLAGKPTSTGGQVADVSPSAGKPEADAPQSSPSPVLNENLDKVAELERKLEAANAQFELEKGQATRIEADRAALQEQLQQQQLQLATANQQSLASQQSLAELRAQLDKVKTESDARMDSLVAQGITINDLKDKLKQESEATDRVRAMQAASNEVHDLMGERNLHIIDVVDTDGAGKTKPAFGRIFLTDNKRLLFYAYDLNEARLQNAKFRYRIWGETSGQSEHPKALGVFYSDDKVQRRWVFKYDDPKVLSHIESVFVTLEPSERDSDRPQGQRLMYAYLRGEVNHP